MRRVSVHRTKDGWVATMSFDHAELVALAEGLPHDDAGRKEMLDTAGELAAKATLDATATPRKLGPR